MNKQNIFKYIFLAFIIIFFLKIVSCTDYAYRHKVSGKIVDIKGNPIKKALVRRVLDLESQTQYGLPSLYKKYTDKNGYFEFNYTGRGRAPKSKAIWHIIVSHPDYKKLKTSIIVSWHDSSNSNYGYIKEDIRLTLQK